MMQMKRTQTTLSPFKVLEDYFERMLQQVSGIKCLVLDVETTPIISLIFSQSKILKKDVYLIERIEMPSDGKMQHLKAIYFIRPTEENLKLLQKEIEKPRFAEYYIFYSNSVPNLTIESLAQIDTNDYIKEIHEVYADYYCLSRDLFSINILNTFGLTKEYTSWGQLDNQILQRTYEGLLSLLLSLKRIPMIKYLSSSEPCFHIASKLTKKLRDERDNNKSQLGADTKTLLLIWDRREDPITPLLNQWTYQAMLHELIGINNNRVDIERKMRAFNEANYSSKEEQMEKEFVVSDHDDQFYCDNMYENFGALADNIRNLIESYQTEQQRNKKMDTLADLQNAVNNLPELKKKSTNLNKHVTLSSEVTKLIEEQRVMAISQVEQEISSKEARNDQAKMVFDILNNPDIPKYQKLKLVVLYALRYENDDKIGRMKEELRKNQVSQDKLNYVNYAIEYAGKAKRSGDIFNTKNLGIRLLNNLKSAVKDVPNLFAQHKPYIMNIINQIGEGTLKESEFTTTDLHSFREKPNEIIIFIVGGATYEEAQHIGTMNRDKYTNILLGGTYVHNSQTFMSEIASIGKERKEEFGMNNSQANSFR
ncbi:vacuolar protein sorting-associated protein (macronuclear) [Tetrahymena thermophila SB210]|uniref:Vacuolar protein sorting-associated protein n=1 Tax=Tetrahymena thermophila (strain SB210) TaxID=312017 RepID=Q236N2_TETTS|nr:vacuolar protein sorting-associated protein [Tetrahymena thermophila SB210]EAR92468.1 vacuolar protein sorting-associated protein [Tetrahymena thermophila SB210]|eukprot:XP_001012713.1 vacuolar protein sorting-associated protein [Tetrahymena thermophila SB210]